MSDISARRLAASVVICTYDRPELFEAALRSCLKNATRKGLPFEVVVADNSRAGHAAEIVDRIASTEAVVRVVPVAPPNISRARNTGLRAAAAPLVAFMDDDLEVEPGWLDALVGTLETGAADVVIGPLRPRFATGEPPDWDPTGARFTRVLDRPTGSVIAVSGPDKPADFAVSTASSLWRKATCFTDPEPFDPEFGVCGGEDLDLFLRLERRGCRILWCAEAGVWETVLPSRTQLRYYRLRVYSGAQCYSAAMLKNAPSRTVAMVNIAWRGLAQTLAYGTAALALSLAVRLRANALRDRSTQLTFATLAGWGKLNWWRRVRLYHVEQSLR